LAELVDIPDVRVIMAAVATALVDDHRKQLVGEVRVLSVGLLEGAGQSYE